MLFEAPGERPADRRLAGSRRTGEQHAALRLQPELLRHLGMLERHDDVRIERLEHVIDALQVLQLNSLDLGDVDVARHVVLAQVLDEAVGVQAIVVAKRDARMTKLTRVEFRRKSMDLPTIDTTRRRVVQVRRADGLVVVAVNAPIETMGNRSYIPGSGMPSLVNTSFFPGLEPAPRAEGARQPGNSGAGTRARSMRQRTRTGNRRR